MLMDKSKYNHYTQTTQISRSTVNKAPPASTAQTDTFFYVLDVFLKNFSKDALQSKLRGLPP